MDTEYNFSEIEKKWQKIWQDENYGQSCDFDDKPKHFHLVEFPYPSGAGLHVGHCMGYGASDAYCRMKRMQGKNVMFPIGWDAFGLPTENFAIKNKIAPQKATADNIVNFKKQIKSLGYAFDWDREINTTDPDYFHWTQWIFLQFYRHAIVDGKLVEVSDDDKTTPRLAYQAEMPVNWCPSCKTNLANEEVINGKCERCGAETEKRMQKQWMLRITAYADRLIDDLDTVDYLDRIKTQQINWIGRSEGAKIKFKLVISTEVSTSGEILSGPQDLSTNARDDMVVDVFTTRADTLFGCTYLVLAPEHPLLENLKFKIQNLKEVDEYIEQAKKKSDLERTELQKEKTGVKLEGVKAINPINGEEVDVWVADYVLANYGTGAVMAVPAHDERDFEFAKKYDIKIKQVISPKNSEFRIQNSAFTDYGILINSSEFDGLESEEAKKKITEKLVGQNAGSLTTNYKLRDWIFSRQHYWGEPIPIIHCAKCGVVPLFEDQLPLELPVVENYEPSDTGESPLSKITDWVATKCPKCGGPARRETDTMPNWAGSSWYYMAYAIAKSLKQKAKSNIFTDNNKELDYWMPVDLYNGGMEHTTLHLLYSRFWHKFLYDLGVVPTLEPYAKRIAHGIILGPDGRKMSKSFGNVINPDDIVRDYGADTLRAYVMFIGPYDQESAWSTAGVQGVHRFLKRVWKNQSLVTKDDNDSAELLVKLNQTIVGVTDDIESFSFNTVVSKLMELNNLIEKIGSISQKSYKKFLCLLSPVAPHIASEIYASFEQDSLNENEWPVADKKCLVSDEIEIVAQINGKVRDKITVKSDIDDEKLKETVLKSARISKLIADKEIVKVIVVPKKLVSIVTK